MAAKARIYKEEGTIENQELLDQLRVAVEELAIKMKATVPISRDTRRVGFGVSKAQRNIAADTVISVARAIKALKGW